MTRYTTFNNPWSIGFEDVSRQLDEVHSAMSGDNYPPHNIVKIDDDHYAVELAVAGFSEKDIDVSVKDRVLTVSGSKEDTRTYVHKGVSTRKFVRTFTLNEHVDVKDASLADGILSIELERNVPEAERPRKISISGKKTFLND